MKLHKYKNYAEYVKSQQKANAKKSSNVWAVEENIKFLCEYLKPMNPELGICHGTRGGYEQAWFNKYLIPDCYTMGTEIGELIVLNTIKWDFNQVNPEWVGKFDFVYSNSFDHAFNPEKTLKVWAGQLEIGGLIILEYDRRQEHTGEISQSVNKVDPVSITLDELIDSVPKWSSTMRVVDVLDMPVVTQEWRKSVVIKVG